jgi:nucleoside-diphosphate-sugar epimerase
MASAVVTRCAGFIGSHLTEALLEDADVVYHLAGEPGVRASWGPRFDRYTHHNVQATQRLLEAATEHAHLRFVYSSSSSIYGDALTLPPTRMRRRDRSPRTASRSSLPSTCACSSKTAWPRSSNGCRSAPTPSRRCTA